MATFNFLLHCHSNYVSVLYHLHFITTCFLKIKIGHVTTSPFGDNLVCTDWHYATGIKGASPLPPGVCWWCRIKKGCVQAGAQPRLKS